MEVAAADDDGGDDDDGAGLLKVFGVLTIFGRADGRTGARNCLRRRTNGMKR